MAGVGGRSSDMRCPLNSQVGAVQGQFSFYGLSQILHQVKTVRYLFGGWCAFTRGFAIPTIAISANRVDFRTCRQPLLDGLSGVLIQKVDHGVTFQVHHDGAVRPPFTFCPFIHAHDRRSHDCRSGAFLQPSQNCVVTDWQPYSPG
jgi:hypothetical protein